MLAIVIHLNHNYLGVKLRLTIRIPACVRLYKTLQQVMVREMIIIIMYAMMSYRRLGISSNKRFFFY